MKVHNLDHMVITANNLEKTIEFLYQCSWHGIADIFR